MERPAALQERVFTRLFEVAEIAKFSPKKLYEYEESLKVYRDWNNVIDTAIKKGEARGKEEGRLEGKLEGRLEEKRVIARNLIKAGLPIPEIETITGLSSDEIKNL